MRISRRALDTPASGIRKIFNKTVGLKDCIHLEIGEPDFPTPSIIKEEAQKALREGYTHYTHNAGLIELRQAIADYYKSTQSVEISPEEVIVTVGGTEALFLSILTTTDIRDEILIPDPGYPPYLSMVRMAGAVPTFYNLEEEKSFLPNINEIESKVSERTKAIVINTPNNPTGAVYPKYALKDLAKLASDHGLVLISDEVYDRIIFDEVEHYSMLRFDDPADGTIVVNSFSKTFAMTGWRIGFALCKDVELIRNMVKLQESVVACAPAMVQRAAIVPLLHVQEIIEDMVKEYCDRRDLLVKLLSDIEDVSFALPRGTFYLLLNVSKYAKDSYDFAERLLTAKRVGVAPGRAFGEQGEGYIRISFANSKENIAEGIERLKDFLVSFRDQRK
jgi:aspartate/methionine/tyrosine aminotransferase